jgi:hypothetical protein
LKAEKERVAKAEAEAERAKVAEAEVLESAAVRLKREEAAAAVEVVLLCIVDISSHEADDDDAGAKLVILTKKRRGLFTSFSRYDSLNRFYCEGTRLYPIWCFFTSWGKRQ